MTKAEERALEAYPKSEKYTTSQRLIVNDLRDGFIQGYEQAEKDIMNEAVECELVCLKDRLLAVLPTKEFRWTVGDKVRIIIVKEDKQ